MYFISIHTVLLQVNTALFPLLLRSLLLSHSKRSNLPFVLAASDANLKHGGLLKCKGEVQYGKGAKRFCFRSQNR